MSQQLHKSKWALIESALSIALPAASLILMARLLEPQDYGMFGLMWAIIGPVWILIECLFSDQLLLKQHADNSDEFTRSAYGITIITAGAAVFSIIVFASIFAPKESQLGFYVLAASLVIPGLYSIPQALAFKSARFKLMAGRTLAGRVLALVVGATLAWNGKGVWALIAIQISNGLVTLISLTFFEEFRVKPKFSPKPITGHWSFIIKIAANSALTIYSKRIFILAIAGFASLSTIGIIEMAMRIVDMIQSIFSGFAKRIGLPIFMRPGTPENQQDERYWSITTITSAAAMLVYALLIAAWGWTLPTFLGEKWGDAGAMVAFLSLAAGLQSLRFFSYDLANLRGKPGLNLSVQVVATIAYLIAGLLTSSDDISSIGTNWLCAALLIFAIHSTAFYATGTLRSWRGGRSAVLIVATTSAIASALAIYWPQEGLMGFYAGAIIAATHLAVTLPLVAPSWNKVKQFSKS